jgi:hypothetical protein
MIDINWIAGFFDGEGCVSINSGTNGRTEKRYVKVSVSIAQKDRDILEKIREQHGGKIYEYKSSNSHALFWQKQCDVKKILEELIPYLIIKKEKAIEALEIIGIPKDRSYSLAMAHKKKVI